jgi:hypothetical protein
MALALGPVAMGLAVPPRRLRLREDRSSGHDRLRQLFANVSAVLGIETPPLHVAPSLEIDIALANVVKGGVLTPSWVVGRCMWQGRSNVQIVQTMARALSYARPSAFLRLVLGGTGGCAQVLVAARGAVARRRTTCGVTPHPVIARLHDPIVRAASRPAWMERLRAVVHQLDASDEPLDVERWGRAVDATARRVGLLLGDELEVSTEDLGREPMFAQRAPRHTRVADLLVHSVSDQHFALRGELGLAVTE